MDGHHRKRKRGAISEKKDTGTRRGGEKANMEEMEETELFIVDTHCRSAFPIQVTLLRHSLHTHQRQKAEFIEQSSRNDQWLLSLRCNLSQSLDAVMHRPLPSVLESEAERLDHSLKEEELRMSISQ